jgi:uncharacterized protein involved in exopolysaccharide biosynthesis
LLWESRRFLGRVTVAGLLLSTLIAFLIPNRYESVARLMPRENPSKPDLGQAVAALAGGAPGLGGIASELLTQKNTSDLLAGVLSSRTVADTLIQKFNLREVYSLRRMDDARKELADRTGIGVDRRSQIITIIVTDKSPQRAAAMAQTYIEELNRAMAEVSTASARRERIFLEGRLQVVKQDLEAAERDFSQFSSKNAAIDINKEGKARADASATPHGPYIAGRSEPEGLRQLDADSNARVRFLQARVAELENQLLKAGGKDESSSLEKGTQSDALYPWVRKLPLLGVGYADLYRRAMIQETLFHMLTQEYELARLQEAKAIATVELLDPPSVPDRKSFPPRLLLILLGTVLAFSCGVTWVFSHRIWEQTGPSNPGKVLAEEVIDTVKTAMPRASRSDSRPRS